jgi:hypothetical protein
MGDIPKSVGLKFSRVGEHMDALDEAINAFLDLKPYSARRVLERDGREHVFRWERFEEPPDRIGLIAGDAIHNLRSSLDHMAVSLAIAGAESKGVTVTWEDLTHIQYPIVTEHNKFVKQLKGLRNVVPAAQTYIERNQPYNMLPKNPDHGTLMMLSSLDNGDKHRSLTTSALSPRIEMQGWNFESKMARLQYPTMPSNKIDAEIARFNFASPQSDVDVPVDFIWGLVLSQGPIYSQYDIRYVIKGFDTEVRRIIWDLSMNFIQPFGDIPKSTT